MPNCRWFYEGVVMESDTHHYQRGSCLQCGHKDPDYKLQVSNCGYCGVSILGQGGTCSNCQIKLNKEATEYANRRIA